MIPAAGQDPLRFADADEAVRQAALAEIVRGEPVLMAVLEGARDLGLPDCWLVAGALYNTVWNVLSGMPRLTGIKDVDLFYFDASDLGYDAEDAVIRRAGAVFADLPLPVEVRNQARVHLWFEQHFGTPYPPLRSAREGIDRFATTTHAVGARLDEAGQLDFYTPFGLGDLFAFRVCPNRRLDNRQTHDAKAAKAKAIWPLITVIPW